MITDVVSARRSTTYRELVDMVIERRVGALPVIDDDQRVVGVVSETDLLRKIEYAGAAEPRLFESRRHHGERVKASARAAGDLMTAPAVAVSPRMSIAAAARLMDRENIKHLPVTDDLGRLIGIVSRGDLLRVHLRADDEIRSEVESGVLAALGIAGTVTTEVKDGTVTLTGRTERRRTAEIAGRMAWQVAGVVDVVSRIGYDYDDGGLTDVVTPGGLL
ncbi:CBS domain-containing protein [Actinoplanes sp. NPDC024001]|uniref:CBS domain-containing protein n=1 Tax=Actinoplanes sp. NPDC024001 TaxID=3154598 RepID=UPI00340FDDE7